MSNGYGVPAGEGLPQADFQALAALNNRISELEDALYDAQNRAQVSFNEGARSVQTVSQEEQDRDAKTAAALASLPETASGADVIRALRHAGL